MAIAAFTSASGVSATLRAPHTPLQALRADYEALTHIDDHTERVYAAMIVALDGSADRVLAALLLYQMVPQLPLPGLEAAFLRGVSSAYAGPVTLAQDGTLISLPQATDRIEVGTLP